MARKLHIEPDCGIITRIGALCLGNSEDLTKRKKIILIVAVLVVVLGTVAALLLSFLGSARQELNVAIQPMFEELAATRWRDSTLRKFATPELRSWLKNNAGEMKPLAKFGRVVDYQGVQNFKIEYGDEHDVALAVVVVEFEAATATFDVNLHRIDEDWRVNKIHLTDYWE